MKWQTPLFVRLFCVLGLLTMPLSPTSQAAPTTRFSVPKERPSPSSSPVESPSLEESGMIIVSPPPLQPSPQLSIETVKNTRPSYYYYQQSFSAQFGAAWDAENEDPREILWLIALKYMLPRPLSPHWELGLSHHSSQKSFFHFSRKFTFRQRQAYRPHLSLGLAHRPRAEQQLIGFLNFDNYLVRAELGFEDLLKVPRSVRMDLSLLAGPQDVLAQFTFGYSWAR